MTFDSDTEKEILSKCIYESVNRRIYEEVKGTVFKEEKTYSKQPLLLARPGSVKTMKNGRIN